MPIVKTEPADTVLYVDDEPRNLSSFNAIFRKYYKIHIATSAEEGIEIMERNPIHLVITDQRMPNITGVEFLEKIVNRYPDVTRIILTGYSDTDAIIGAINRGHVYKYITKPWKTDDLKITIDDALEVTRLRRENGSLLESLRKTNEELDRFLYSASHDLRSPVASLLGLLELMKKDKNLTSLQQYLDMSLKTTYKLDGFIKDLVDFSYNNRSEIRHEAIDFNTFVSGLLDEFRFYYDSSKIDKQLSVKQDSIFLSDKNRLKIIFDNMISNAIRFYSPLQSYPYLKIEIVADSEVATIKFTDNGRGIGEKHLPKIFDMFYRATEEAAGSGLGLYLVRETVEKLGGTVSVYSVAGDGCSFTITIPNLVTA
jgi:signal transduction histidine kinase